MLPTITGSVDFRCSIGPLLYDCTGHPGQFYEYLGKKILINLFIFEQYISQFRKFIVISCQKYSIILGWLSYLLMIVFLACCALNLTWTVGSTKYCEMQRTMSELMKKLRLMNEMGVRKGIFADRDQILRGAHILSLILIDFDCCKMFSGNTDSELLGKVAHKIFYQNKDLSLLLVLLASSSGIANAFLVMALFDENFR